MSKNVRKIFDKFRQRRDSDVRYEKRKSIAAEHYDPDEDVCDTLPFYQKSEKQREQLRNTLKECLYFKHLEGKQIDKLVDAMFEKKIEKADEIVILEGDSGDYLFVVEDGEFEAYQTNRSNRDKPQFVPCKPRKIYGNGGFFGELALMYNVPRAMSILSNSPGRLWAMDRLTFRKIVIKSTNDRLKQFENFLKNVPILNQLTPYERTNISYALKSREYDDGSVIIRQGDKADEMYFIESGNVRCLIKQDGEGSREVNRVGPGGYVGELALLTDQPRAATVISMGKTKVAILSRDDFIRLLGPCKEIMKRNTKDYNKQLEKVFKNH